MKIRIEGASSAELDVAERLLRLVFEAAEASPDYRNRERTHRPDGAPGSRRYLNEVKPRTQLDLWAVVFGNYEPAEVVSLHISKDLAEAAEAAADKQLDTHMHEVNEWAVKLPGADGQ